MKNIVPGSPEEKTEQWAERGIDMETWGFYVSGVRYGTCRKEGERVFHSPLDVTSGEFLPERELAPEDDRYVVLGKMNVREALLHLEPCQEGIRRGEDRFTASSGEIYEKKDKGAYVQRHIKFPRDLAVKDGQIVAFTTPARELCSVLVKDGYEDETVLRQWKEMGFGLPYLVHGPKTFMVPMRDGVKLAADGVPASEKRGSRCRARRKGPHCAGAYPLRKKGRSRNVLPVCAEGLRCGDPGCAGTGGERRRVASHAL